MSPDLVAERDRRRQQRLRVQLGIPARALAWVEVHGELVTGGPFAGMHYPKSLVAVADAPLRKLQGNYEEPLQPAVGAAIERLGALPGSLFVDAGCADGYYAVGIARSAGCPVEAFDLARSARVSTAGLAAANGVEVGLRRRATEAALLALAPRTGALICDIEGGEMSVITPKLAAALSRAVVIVELHGLAAVARVPERFAKSHSVELVQSDADADEELRGAPTPWLVARPFA